MLKEKKHAAQMDTHMLFPPMIPLGPAASQSSGVFAFQPVAHGPSVIKGCVAFKLVFGVPMLPSQQAADFLWD